jgi:hypothetical protein
MPFVPPSPWTLFRWGSRGLWYFTGVPEVYVSHIFIPNGIRVVLFAEAGTGQQLLHVFHMQGPNAAPDYTDCLSAAQIVGTWWGSNYRNMVANTTVGRQVVATGMNSAPAAQATVLLTLAGTRPGNSAPGEISCALKWFTHSSGRRNHGGPRGFPPNVLDYVGDRFQASYITAMLGVFGNLLISAATGGYPVVIASLADVALKPIAGVTNVDDIIDSQRRRTLGRGR